MRKYLFLLLSAVGLMAGSCVKNNVDTTPVVAPDGTFTGQFTRFHKKFVNNAYQYDTLKTNVTVIVSSNGYTFRMTGDTTIHSGSNGTYLYDANYIRFNDALLPSNLTTEPAKPHLVGLYAYAYDGTNFLLQRSYPLDTLIFQYRLKRM